MSWTVFQAESVESHNSHFAQVDWRQAIVAVLKQAGLDLPEDTP